MAKAAAARPMSKSQMIAELAEKTELSKKQVQQVLDEIEGLVEGALSKKGTGVFVLPGLLKIMRKENPARPAKEGRNPKTGETMMIAAKPKRTVVKVRALKKLKGMV
ncbi:DNA-binding protein HRm [Caulifigura coniformis]|uniref:Viral histone-like protein n=1 Tax=Caulifigura coniformis TaxID=2527983 RepID=A0A517SJW1_9PLAN|nr:HU family DNA-binding protein [Caulifigura coniformis]QDT56409.1 DNA-binding protein HRm [Caulifigura coniformis]